MDALTDDSPAAWLAADMAADSGWRFTIPPAVAATMAAAVKAAYDPDRPLFDYRRDEFDFGDGLAVLAAARTEALHGRGLALVHGLPRADLTEAEFELLNWAIGLHSGVARPQGKASQYIAAVRDVGTDYRAANGRGFSSNFALDFHVDGGDLTTLGCYNTAKEGGQSMITSSLSAFLQLRAERPDLADCLGETFYFSRQQEEAPDEGPFYAQPLLDMADGRAFAKWNRNRVRTAQDLDGVPALSARQSETIDLLDEILRRPALMVSLYLAPGDLQILNNHTMLHSRTAYVDHDDPADKRLLHRLWLAPPDSVELPESWWDFYRATAPGTVRGGIRGHHHDAACHAFDRRQAADHGMTMPG